MSRGEEVTLAWPAMLVRDDEGRVQVRFPDFPEALTDGADEAEALAEAADCLAEAVAARIADGEVIPAPSPLRRGMRAVPLEPVLASKPALRPDQPFLRPAERSPLISQDIFEADTPIFSINLQHLWTGRICPGHPTSHFLKAYSPSLVNFVCCNAFERAPDCIPVAWNAVYPRYLHLQL